MRIILPDPGIQDRRGHHYAHAWSIAEECKRRSIDMEVLTHLAVSDDVSDRLKCSPVFRTYFYDRGPKRRASWYYLALHLVRSWKYRKDLSLGLSGRAGPGDVVLLNTIDCSLLKGYARWLERLPAARRPFTVIVLRFLPEEGLPRGHWPEVSRRIYKRLLNRIEGLAPGKLLFGTDTKLIAQDFEALLGAEVARIPLPLKLPDARPRDAQSDQVHLVFLGGPQEKRGFHLLPEALSEAMAKFPNLRATVQVSHPDRASKKSLVPLVDKLRQLEPRLEIIEGEIDEAEFYRRILSSDAVLLPYDPKVYAKRSSQMLAESASLGRPVIVTRGGFLEHEVDAAGMVAVLCERFDSRALAEAIAGFVTNRRRLVEQAWASSSLLSRGYRVEDFVDCLEFLAKGKVVSRHGEEAVPPRATA